ncbi:MAG: homocysteine S-methyltransferase family protein [Ignavibacteriales bacterium]|nr:homocysteine S-methyltransferase family protein [Ignavibacteriales bacterium]
MNHILNHILDDQLIITDGAWGTVLHALGLKPGECADSWNINNPEKVKQIARAYTKAGSCILLTNTFRANRITLKTFNLDSKIKEINSTGVKISKHAIRDRGFVFASIGPIGSSLETNKIPDEELKEIFYEQAIILADAGADAIVIESVFNLNEGYIALEAVKRTGLPVVFSMTFDKENLLSSKDDLHATHEYKEKLSGADIVGLNCGTGVEDSLLHIKKIRTYTKAPLWFKPSAGIPSIVRNKIVYSTTIKNFVEYSRVLKSLGVKFIGGCCGTTPEYIKLLSMTLRNKSES